jgi:haloalkane dehalogenase
MDSYAPWLAASSVPKLLLHARPGMLIGPSTARRIGREFANTTVVDVGRGRHFLAEDQPAAIGRAIATFAASPGRAR